jgi:hypothetical protein
MRVDIDAAVRDEPGTNDLAVVRQGLSVPLFAKLIQEPRRGGDAGEDERDRPTRQVPTSYGQTLRSRFSFCWLNVSPNRVAS